MWSLKAGASPISSGGPIAVEAGEVIVFTRGDPHVMSSSPGMRADPFAPGVIEATTRSQLPFFINYGGDGPASAKVVCGFLACDAQPFNPLLENLPPVIKAGDPNGQQCGWLGQLIRLAMMSRRTSAPAVKALAKVSELMFIEVVRRHLEALPPEQAGWLAGLRDPFVGKALSLMHAAPVQNWTIENWPRKWAIALGSGASASPTSLACRRCSISPNGGCKSPRGF